MALDSNKDSKKPAISADYQTTNCVGDSYGQQEYSS